MTVLRDATVCVAGRNVRPTVNTRNKVKHPPIKYFGMGAEGTPSIGNPYHRWFNLCNATYIKTEARAVHSGFVPINMCFVARSRSCPYIPSLWCTCHYVDRDYTARTVQADGLVVCIPLKATACFRKYVAGRLLVLPHVTVLSVPGPPSCSCRSSPPESRSRLRRRDFQRPGWQSPRSRMRLAALAASAPRQRMEAQEPQRGGHLWVFEPPPSWVECKQDRVLGSGRLSTDSHLSPHPCTGPPVGKSYRTFWWRAWLLRELLGSPYIVFCRSPRRVERRILRKTWRRIGAEPVVCSLEAVSHMASSETVTSMVLK